MKKSLLPIFIFVLLLIPLVLSSCGGFGGTSGDNGTTTPPVTEVKTDTFTLSYEVNGGIAIPKEEVAKGFILQELPEPKKEGYRFSGWFTDMDLKNKAKVNVKIIEDTTFFAKWDKLYTLTYDTNGGNEIKPYESIKYVTLPIARKDGYVFVGWYAEPDFSGNKYTTSIQLTEDVTLYADWTRKGIVSSTGFSVEGSVYTLSEKQENETASIELADYFTLDRFSTLEAYTKEKFANNYELLTTTEVSLNEGSNLYYVRVKTATGVTTLYSEYYEVVIYKKKQFDVKLYNLGEVIFEEKIVEGETIPLPEELVEAGYELDGFYTELSGENKWNFAESKVTSVVNLYAVWEPTESTVTEGLSYALTVNKKFELIGLNGFSGENLILPSIYRGAYVKSLSATATEGGASVKKLILPSTVTTLADGCLSGLTTINELVFNGTSYCLNDQKCLGRLFPVSESGILQGSTYYAIPYSITIITINSGATLPSYAFQNCSFLTEVVMSEGMISIGGRAFDGCTGLSEIIIPSTVRNLGVGAFCGTRLSAYNIPEPVTALPTECFKDCINLLEYNIPSTVTSLGKSVFSGTGISNILIPSTITTLDNDTFEGCVDNMIIYFKASSFDGFTTDIPCYFNVTAINSNDDFEYINLGAEEGLVLTKRRNENGIIPEAIDSVAVSTLGKRLFAGYTGATVTISSSVKFIREEAFYNSQITAIVLPRSLERIDNGAFKSCETLAEITLPFVGEAVVPTDLYKSYFGYIFGVYEEFSLSSTPSENIGGVIQYSRTLVRGYNHYHYFIPEALTKVTISAEVDSPIPQNSFYNCRNLTELSILSAKNIGTRAFENCISLSTLEIKGDSLTTGERTYASCFLNCPIKNVKISYSEGFYASMLYMLTGKSYDEDENTNPNNYTVQEVTVTKGTYLPEDAFANCVNLKKVNLPLTLTNIGGFAFAGCSSLKSVLLPASLTTISEGAFKNCNHLSRVSFENPENLNLYYIGYGAFENCLELDYFFIPSVPLHTTEIINTAFTDCIDLTLFFEAAGYTEIPGHDHWNENNRPVIFNAERVVENGFGYIIYDNTAYLTDYYGTDEVITIPSQCNSSIDVKVIFPGTFIDNQSITEVNLSDTLEEIGSEAFMGALNLTTVSFGFSLKSIGESAFYSCNIEEIIPPSTLVEMESKAFGNNINLSDVDLSLSAALRVIKRDTFNGCAALKNVTLGSGIQIIEERAFKNSGLEVVDWSLSELLEIGVRVFESCSLLSEIALPPTLISIGVGCFSYCSELTTIGDFSNVLFIGGEAFLGCDKLITTETNGVKYVLNFAVGVTEEATSVTIKEGTVGIVSEAFYASNLVSLTLPSTLRFIGKNAFAGANGLSYTVKNNVNYLEDINGKLWAISGVGSATFSFDVDTVGIADAAFSNNKTIVSVVIPKGVKTIGAEAFFYVTNMTTLSFESGSELLYIGSKAFNGCSALNNDALSDRVYLPEHLSIIGSDAFYGTGSGVALVFYVSNEIDIIGFCPFRSDSGSLALQFEMTMLQLSEIPTGYNYLKKNENSDYVPQYNISYAYPEG